MQWFEHLTPPLNERVSMVESVLDHTFADKSLVQHAITHPSAVEADAHLSYERLEFIGDSIVGQIVGLEAFLRFPDVDEGTLTKIRIAVVNGVFLSECASNLGLADVIIFGSCEIVSGSRGMNSALENVFEALVAALYLDAGYAKARAWVLECVGEHISMESVNTSLNPKSAIQELVQARGLALEYIIVDSRGPSHAPQFDAVIKINGHIEGKGTGATKKEAEAAAAKCALDNFGQQK